eukprot:COSAG01_NODE_228_length_21104_cov_210.303832_34_plen_88_part_00
MLLLLLVPSLTSPPAPAGRRRRNVSLWHDVTLSGALGPAAMAEGEAEELPKKEMIKLISKEGHEFSVEKQAAMVSNTIKNMLTGPGT